MKIAFNPSTVAALTTPPNNKDITFDLRGRNIFARGVKFLGTDTWRDIKINNVSIGSNTLDLRNGSNTTLTNTNGVVTINSTWRPVVDNLTSDSTTSSLSAKQGKVLKSLIDGKSNSGHTHDDRYLKLTGGTMASNALITFTDSGSWGTDKGPQGARGGLYWTGQSDYAKLYAEETVEDNLDLVIQFGDDNSNGLSIRNKANTQTSYISAGGVITTGTFKGNLDWSYITNKPTTATRWPSWAEVTGKPSSFTPSTHTHGLSNSVFFLNMPSISGNAKWKEVFGYPVNYNLLLSVRINNPAPEWCVGNFGSGILYGGSDTKGFMSSAYNEPLIMWAGGNGSSDDSVPKWYIGIKGIHKSIYNLATIASEANSAYNLRHSHSNKSVLDGITSGLVNNWNVAYTFVNTITGTDTDKVINKWDEIVNFLAGITEDNKLNTLLNSKLSVYELANNTNVGAIKNNGIYYSTSDASSGTLVNSPFNNGFTLINMTSLDNGDDLRRSRLAFNAYGEIKVSNDRGLANTAETWYNILTSNNSGINGSTIKLNGTSITVYSSSTADGRYVKKSGDTMSGALNFANNTWNKVGDDVYMGDCNVSGHFGIKAANTTYPGIAFFNNANAHLGNLTAYNGNIKYGAYSLRFLDNGNTSVGASTWTNPFSSYNSNAVADGQAICVWGQSSSLSNLAADSGDMSLWLKRVNAKAATLNMVLDGEYYANGHLRLAHISEIPTSLKNPYALTISLNGTSQGPYDGSAAKNINITPSSIGASSSSHTHSYLPLAGGTMTGNIKYIGKGTSYIGNGENDAANGVGGALNNLVISSWYGVSFTTSCSGLTYTNKNAVSINCRNGYVYANTFIGTFSGNASSATKLQTPRSIWGQSFDGTNNINGTFYFTNGDATMKIYDVASTNSSYGNERVAIQTSFDGLDPLTSSYPSTYPDRSALLLLPRGGNIGIGTTSPSYKLHVNGTLGVNNIATFNINNSWLSPSVLLIGRLNDSKDASKAIIGVTNGNLHIDAYHNKELYLNYYNKGKIRFGYQTGSYYISENGSYYSGTAASANNASTATKLQTARNIALGTDLRGSANFDGSSNITISANINACTVGVGSTNGLPFKRIAHFETGGSWNDNALLLYISLGYINGSNGICRVEFRTDNISSSSTSVTASAAVRWLVRNGYGLDSLYAGYYVTAGKAYIDIYLKTTGSYQGTVIRVLLDSRGGINSNVLLINSYYYSDTNHKEAYNSIEAASTALYNRAYTRIVSGSDVGTVSYSNSTGSVHWNNVTNKPSTFAPAAHTHTVFNNNLMIKGTNGVSDSASIHLGIGDSDTGFKWISDGKCLIYANNAAVGEWTSGGMNWFKNPTVNGNKIWNAGNDGSGSGLDADLLDGWHLDSIRKNVGYSWSAKYRINNWSRIIKIDNYSNILLAINFSLNSQASNHLYLISTGYGCGNIVQLGANGFNSNSAIKIRLTENTATSHNVEIYSTYGYNGATELSINCNYTRIDGNSTITTYLTYTAGGGTVRKEITSSYSKIVANLQGNSDTTTKLQTPRQINGTNFDGSANITTSYWGTTRTLTIGNSGKSVNGSTNISWSLSEIGAASSSHSHNYAANENYGGFIKSGRLPISGFYQSNASESGGNAPWSGWMHLINCLHNNTGNNYALLIAASFGNNNTFKIRVTNNNVNNAWRDIIHSGNIGSQSVAYASNADMVDGYHASGLWRSDGATWNPNANISLTANGNNQEWSFDIRRNGYTGCYWHVWDSARNTMLKVNADNGKVYAPYNFVGNLEGNASTATKLTSSAGNATLPIYFSDGKPIACTASSIFSNLSNSGNNISVTVAGQNRTLTVGYANNADKVDGYHATDGRTFTGNINWSNNWNDAWSDGTNKHPWYGFDHRYPNTGAYSTTISDFFGMTIKTANTLRLDFGTLLLNGTSIYSINVASATKLQTPRTIWGQSFNGTADVNGTIYINNNNSGEGAIRLNNNINSNARISAINDQVIFNTGAAIRFGGTSWDWNVWAGLKYTHSNKTIYLGIADGSVFNANSALSGGSLRFPGISNVYATTFNGSLSGNASTATNADKIDGVHLNGIFTAFGNNAHNITATIGGVTKSFLVNWAADSDKLDGYHENSFLRYRGDTSTDLEATLWSLIGIKLYNNALPDNLTGVYNYGSVISLPGSSSRFEIYASHLSSNGNGLYYRSGWGSDKKTWLKFIDSSNIGSQSVNYANSAGNADKLDGIHANGLLTALSNSNNGISITVGGTTKSISNISVNYASSAGNADTLDGEHASSFVRAGHYESADLNKLDTYSFIRSVNSQVSSTSPKGDIGWYNVILLVHRNGDDDGPNYIGLIALGMTSNVNDIFFRCRRTDPWKTIIHSNNYTEFIDNYYWANVKISTSSSTTTSPTVSNLTATSSIRMGNIYLLNTNEINSTSGIHLNYQNSGNISLCYGGGKVGIGTTSPTYKLDVNGLMRASGFHHSSMNSDNYILLAGGGYSQGVPVRYWAIYYIYIGKGPADVTYTKRSGNYNFITSKDWESEGAAIFNISFPSGYNKNNTLIFGNGDHCTSSWLRSPVYVTITTSTDFSSESKIRVLLSNDSSLDTGYANIYFMCMG